MDGDPFLRHELSDKKNRSAMRFVLELKQRFPSTCSVAVLLQYNGTFATSLPNPRSVSMFEQNTASFIAKTDATSSASMVDMAVNQRRLSFSSEDLRDFVEYHDAPTATVGRLGPQTQDSTPLAYHGSLLERYLIARVLGYATMGS